MSTTMSMDMSSMTTTAAAMATSAASAHSSHGSMAGECKISMIWNWYTIDACFLSRDWHIRSTAAYAGSVVAIFFLVILLESFRRMAREYDRRIVQQHTASSPTSSQNGLNDEKGDIEGAACPAVRPFVPSWQQQMIRSTFYFVQFGAGYILMLLAMYYNGGIIFAIFLGAGVGHFLAARDTVGNHGVISKDCCH